MSMLLVAPFNPFEKFLMTLFQECSQPLGGRAILLSIKPKYSDLILSGEKRVEFRRTWAADEVGLIAIYASSPIQRIVALVGAAVVFRCENLGGSRGRCGCGVVHSQTSLCESIVDSR